MKTKFYNNTVIAALAALSFILQIMHFGLASNWGMWIDFVAVPWLIAFFLLGVEAAFTTSIIMLILISLVAASGVVGAIMKFTATLPMFIIPAMILFKRKTLMASLAILIIFTSTIGMVFLHDVVNFQAPKSSEGLTKQLSISENLQLKISASNLTPAKSITSAIRSLIIILGSVIIFTIFFLIATRQSETKSMEFFESTKNMLITLLFAVIVRGIISCIANYYFAIPTFFGMSTEQSLGFIPWQIMFLMNAIQGAIEFLLAWLLVYKTHIRKRFGK